MKSLLRITIFLVFNIQLVFGADSLKTIDLKNCKKEIEAQIIRWDDSKEVWRSMIDGEGLNYSVRPTSMMSVWLEYKSNVDELYVSKVTPMNVTRVSFDKECNPSLTVLPGILYKSQNPGLDDKGLFEEVQKSQSGLIYTWSPHMSLSIEGVMRIQELAKEMRLPILVLLDPKADLGNAKKILAEKKIEQKNLLSVSSMEMVYRRALIHFPNLLVYKNGKIVDGLLPGLSTKAEYAVFIKKQLSKKW